MPIAATREAQHVDDLFSFLVALGAFVFLGVVGTIIYSIDVIHGFYVPVFRFKQDILPGDIMDFTFTLVT